MQLIGGKWWEKTHNKSVELTACRLSFFEKAVRACHLSGPQLTSILGRCDSIDTGSVELYQRPETWFLIFVFRAEKSDIRTKNTYLWKENFGIPN